jgi:hypothetical protein
MAPIDAADASSMTDAGDIAGRVDASDAATISDASDGAPGVDAADAAPTSDATPEASAPPVVGRHSYVVQSTYDTTRDGGAGGGSPFGGQEFTMVLDADALVAVVGTSAGMSTAALVRTDPRTFTATSLLSLPSTGCPGSNVSYTAATFTVDDNDGLTGTAQAQTLTIMTDIGMSSGGPVKFSGRPDNQPPSLSGSGLTVNPLGRFTLRASEPLAASVSLALTAGNDVLPLTTLPSMGPLSVISAFDSPNVVLRYGTTYRVALDGFVDFAGNVGTTGTAFEITTIDAPEAAAEDGFESATGTMLGGARIISGAGWPVLAGAKSLYAPGSSGLGGASPLAVRLPVAPGDNVIRFSYQQVSWSASGFLSTQTFRLGSVGGTPAFAAIKAETAPYTPLSLPDQSTIYLGAPATAEIPLPAGAAGEVVIERVVPFFTGCGPPTPFPGLIVDDLRVEP